MQSRLLSFVRPLLLAAPVLWLTACSTDDGDSPGTPPAQEVVNLVTDVAGDTIPGQYIIMLDEARIGALTDTVWSGRLATIRNVADTMLYAQGMSALTRGACFCDIGFGFVVEHCSAADRRLLGQLPAVRAIYPDRRVGIGPVPTAEALVVQPAQGTSYGITKVGGPGRGVGKAAWIIDTGIQLDHPDLTVSTLSARSFVPGVTSATDDNGHGTHVAGIVGALNNSIGVVGVAAGATVVPVKVLNAAGQGTMSQIIQGIDYVTSKGRAGQVANLSLGGPPFAPLDQAILRLAAKGVYVTIAAGNSAVAASGTSPARVAGARVFTVSACDQTNRFASFSNFGNPPIDWCEPGVSIRSTYLSSGYASLSGTSMAAPHLAGVLLLTNGVVRSAGPVIGDRDAFPDLIGRR